MTPTQRPRIVVLDDLERAARTSADWSAVEAVADVVVHEERLVGPALLDAIAGADALCVMRERTPLPAELIARLPRLRLIATTAAGNAAIDLAACAEAGIVVSGTRSRPGAPAELTWALILAAARRIDLAATAMREGGWPASVGLGLHGRSLGVLGLGKIGSTVAAVGAVFGMDVLAWSPTLTAERAAASGARLVAREEVFSADIVSVNPVLNAATRGSVTAADLASMHDGAWIVNTARAAIVDQDALLAEAASGRIGVALDVFAEEPLPADSPWRRLPNAVLTPHLGYVTDTQLEVWYGDVVENLLAWLAGEPIRRVEPPDRPNGAR